MISRGDEYQLGDGAPSWPVTSGGPDPICPVHRPHTMPMVYSPGSLGTARHPGCRAVLHHGYMSYTPRVTAGPWARLLDTVSRK